jgi:flagellar FliJ protein
VSRFQFRLQSVVKLRERERDAAAGAYQQAMAAKQNLETQVQSLLEEHAAQFPHQTVSVMERVDPQRILESQRYQMHLLHEVAQLRSQIQLIEAECERRRMNMVLHEQKLRSLEKLREKQHREWEDQQLGKEQAMLDQWSGFKYWDSEQK